MTGNLVLLNTYIVPVLKRFRASPTGRQSGKNAAYSLSEYLLVPILYLVATPFFVKHLGLEQYGIWMLINSIIGVTGAINFGFGDATLRFVSMYRGRRENQAVVRVVQSSFSISLLIALVSGLVLFLCAPILVGQVFKISPTQNILAIRAFQLGAILIGVRVIEMLFGAVFRGFERYDLSAMATLAVRVSVVLSSLILIFSGFGLQTILIITLIFSLIGLLVQGSIIGKLMDAPPWIPRWDQGKIREMFGFGVYSWLQSMAGLLFSQSDRIVIGSMLGMPALGIYSVCLQLAQQVHAVLAASFSVLFPLTSRRRETADSGSLLETTKLLICLNIAAAILLALPLILFGDVVLAFWIGPSFAVQGGTILRLLAVAFLALSTNIVIYYILLGAGDVKFVSLINILAGIVCLITTIVLVPAAGLKAAAFGKFCYAAITGLSYFRLTRVLGIKELESAL